MIDLIHHLNGRRVKVLKFLLVAWRLEWQPDVPPERHNGGLQLILAFVAPVIPCQSNVREPNQECEHPEISVRGKPVPERHDKRKNDTLDIEHKWTTWEESTSHYISIREFFPRSHAGQPARNIGGSECVCTGIGASRAS